MKVAFVSLGCAKNLVNTEQMMALVRSAGHEITAQPEGGRGGAQHLRLYRLRQERGHSEYPGAGRAEKEGKLGKLLVTGCLSQRYQDELMEELPEVDGVMLGTGSYTEIVPALEELMAGGTPTASGISTTRRRTGAHPRHPPTPPT